MPFCPFPYGEPGLRSALFQGIERFPRSLLLHKFASLPDFHSCECEFYQLPRLKNLSGNIEPYSRQPFSITYIGQNQHPTSPC